MQLEYEEIKEFVGNLDDDTFKQLREIVYKRVENDIKEGKHETEKQKVLTKEKPRLLWDND